MWIFQTNIRGENPATIFFETHIPWTILPMSEFIYPPRLIFQSFPHSSVLKRETECASDVHQPVQLLFMSFSMWLIMETILWFSISLR